MLVLQWTGTSRKRVVVPWQRMTDVDAVEALAARIETTPRVWCNFSTATATAIGEVLEVGAARFADVPGCRHRGSGISGDGSSDEGPGPRDGHGLLRPEGIVVNALVIEGAEPGMTAYFRENVIHGSDAFVITDSDYAEYPARKRRKLRRDVTKPISKAAGDSFAPHL